MAKKISYYIGILFTLLAATAAHAQVPDGVGQTIQINTHLHSFAGKPSWLLMIRDIDHGQNIPYVFDFTRGNNFWLAFTYGRNYVITASTLQFAPHGYNPCRTPPYSVKVTHDFCHLESHGRISRGESMAVTIVGDLSSNTGTYSCNVTRFSDNHFSVTSSD